MCDSLKSKNRFRKIFITDIAIDKVPLVKYKGLSDKQNDALHRIARRVLLVAQSKNNSNEVAITTSLHSTDLINDAGVAIGDEHEIKICADVKSNHIIVSAKDVSVVVVHNHPSTQTLSIEDIGFFLYHTTVKIMAVVTNQGTVHYLLKDLDYDHDAAESLRQECVEDLTEDSSVRECYEAALDFLTHCSEVGLYYH